MFRRWNILACFLPVTETIGELIIVVQQELCEKEKMHLHTDKNAVESTEDSDADIRTNIFSVDRNIVIPQKYFREIIKKIVGLNDLLVVPTKYWF